MKDAFKSIALGALAVVGFLYTVGAVAAGITYLGHLLSDELATFWSVGWWPWVLLAPWPPVGVFLIGMLFLDLGEKLRGNR